MKIRPIFVTIGFFLTALAVIMLLPAIVDFYYSNDNWQKFFLAAIVTIFFGLLLTLANTSKNDNDITIRETFILTTTTWLVLAVFAALPLILCNKQGSYTDSFFEAISGLTTTGATVNNSIYLSSYGILLWRALLQWFGGIGIIVMAFTVMPVLKIGGIQLLHNEFSDRSEKIMPRIEQISSAIVMTYTLFTCLCMLALYLAGMSFMDAVCHSLSTISTGGFSTADTSVGYFNNIAIEIIISIFMIISSITLILFIKSAQTHTNAVLRDSQVRVFLYIVIIAILLATIFQIQKGVPFLQALRGASFNMISIATTTGFSSTDYTQWGISTILLTFILMMIGGCTGSTAGGIKILRYQIMFATVKSYLFQIRRPRGIFTPSYNNQPISASVSTSVFTFFGIYIFSLGLLVLGLSLYNLDIQTILSAAVSALNNIGPGFGPEIGPHNSYLNLPDGAKWMLMLGMLIGRLEYITFFVMILPSFWKN